MLWFVIAHFPDLVLIAGGCGLAVWASRLPDPQSEMVDALTDSRKRPAHGTSQRSGLDCVEPDVGKASSGGLP